MSIPLAQRADAPEFVPLPGEHHGIEWEPLTGAHHGALAALFARMEARDNPPYRTSAEEVEEMLSSASQWRGLVGIVRRGLGAGRMVAFAQVVLRFPGRAECVCVGGVDPDFRGIGLGSAIVDWQEGTARQMLSEVEGDGPAQISCHVESGQDDLEAQLKVHGFRWARTYYELRASLADLPPVPDLGSYMSIEAWGPQWEEPALRAANRLNESEWGRPRSPRNSGCTDVRRLPPSGHLSPWIAPVIARASPASCWPHATSRIGSPWGGARATLTSSVSSPRGATAASPTR